MTSTKGTRYPWSINVLNNYCLHKIFQVIESTEYCDLIPYDSGYLEFIIQDWRQYYGSLYLLTDDSITASGMPLSKDYSRKRRYLNTIKKAVLSILNDLYSEAGYPATHQCNPDTFLGLDKSSDPHATGWEYLEDFKQNHYVDYIQSWLN